MNIRYIYCLLSGLFLLTGCNPDVFVDKDEILTVSANTFVFSDTGDTLKLSLNRQDWSIKSVLYTSLEKPIFQGTVNEEGIAKYPAIMQLEGLGEIWVNNPLDGFKIVRDSFDSLTVIMQPNYNFEDCRLQITLATDTQILDLIYSQIPSQGYIIDRVEWDELLSSTGSCIYNNVSTNKINQRKIYISNGMFLNGKKILRPTMMKILNVNSISLPIPDAFPDGNRLTFSGDTLELLSYIDDYELEMNPTRSDNISSITPAAKVKYLTYSTDFHIYVKHTSDADVSLCFTGSFNNYTPDRR